MRRNEFACFTKPFLEDGSMTFSILVEQDDGQFAASLLGAPKMRAVKPSRDKAISALETEIQQRVEGGELLLLEIDALCVSAMAGKYSSDPTLREICENALKIRDDERTQ